MIRSQDVLKIFSEKSRCRREIITSTVYDGRSGLHVHMYLCR